jgi:hypothetical protein
MSRKEILEKKECHVITYQNSVSSCIVLVIAGPVDGLGVGGFVGDHEYDPGGEYVFKRHALQLPALTMYHTMSSQLP